MPASVTRKSVNSECDRRGVIQQSAKRQNVTDQFATCKVGGMLLLKLVGYIHDERAEILEISEEHIVLRLGQPWHLRWWHGVERRRPIAVRLEFAEPGEDLPNWQKANARRSMVKVDIRPLTWSFRKADFGRRADEVLRTLRLHFVAD